MWFLFQISKALWLTENLAMATQNSLSLKTMAVASVCMHSVPCWIFGCRNLLGGGRRETDVINLQRTAGKAVHILCFFPAAWRPTCINHKNRQLSSGQFSDPMGRWGDMRDHSAQILSGCLWRGGGRPFLHLLLPSLNLRTSSLTSGDITACVSVPFGLPNRQHTGINVSRSQLVLWIYYCMCVIVYSLWPPEQLHVCIDI